MRLNEIFISYILICVILVHIETQHGTVSLPVHNPSVSCPIVSKPFWQIISAIYQRVNVTHPYEKGPGDISPDPLCCDCIAVSPCSTRMQSNQPKRINDMSLHHLSVVEQAHQEEWNASCIPQTIIERNFQTITDPRAVDELLNRNTDKDKRWKHSEALTPGWVVTH